MSDSGAWAGVLLILAGVWLVMQTTVGDLPGRLLSWAGLYDDAKPDATPPAQPTAPAARPGDAAAGGGSPDSADRGVAQPDRPISGPH